jgi:hypothetical protein
MPSIVATLIKSVRCISGAPSGRVLNPYNENIETLGNRSCLTPIYVSLAVRHVNDSAVRCSYNVWIEARQFKAKA